MQKERGRNNASSLFGVHQIPSTQQTGNLLAPISPEHLAPVFVDIIDALHQHRALDTHRQADGRLLIALDGTECEVPAVVKTCWTGTRRLTETDRWLNDLPGTGSVQFFKINFIYQLVEGFAYILKNRALYLEPLYRLGLSCGPCLSVFAAGPLKILILKVFTVKLN